MKRRIIFLVALLLIVTGYFIYRGNILLPYSWGAPETDFLFIDQYGFDLEPTFSQISGEPSTILYSYTVKNDRLVRTQNPLYLNPKNLPQGQLYRFDVAKNQAVPVSFEEAASYTLKPQKRFEERSIYNDWTTESPDGYLYDPFWSDCIISCFLPVNVESYPELVKGFLHKRLNAVTLLKTSVFIGWIIR